MKKILVTLFLFSCLCTHAQTPKLLKTLASTVTEPAATNSDYWVNNQWSGLFFYQGKGTPVKLCVTDGTDAGTKFLADIGSGTVHKIIPAKDFVYIITSNIISASPYTIRYELWKSNGTAAGTSLITTLPDAVGISNASQFISDVQGVFNFSLDGTTNKMFFSAYDASNGNELWVTDGTSAGTTLLKDLKPGTGSSYPWGFMKIGNEVFFNCTDVGLERKLWKTDGTATGTVKVNVPEPFFIVNGNISKLGNKMIFFATNTTDGFEPYVSDGTTSGTFMLGNFNSTAVNSGNSLLPYVDEANLRTNSKYCFLILHNGTDSSLYRTDGTIAGTIRVAPAGMSIYTRISSGGYTDVDEKDIWIVRYNNIGSGNAESIYKSDGTTAGTYLVAQNISYGQKVKIYKNALWMQARNTASVSNVEPWRSGGNQATTNKAFEVAPGEPLAGFFFSSDPYGFFITNNKLYFFAKNAAGNAGLYEYNGDFTFNGSATGGNWSDSTNWNSGMPPGIVDSVYVNAGTPNALTVNNTKAYAGTLMLGNNASVTITNGTDSLFIAKELSVAGNNNFTGSGVLVSKSFTANSVEFKSGFTANTVSIESNTNLQSGTIAVNNEIKLVNGRLTLNTGNLLLKGNTAAVTALNNQYIVTNNTGNVQVENIGAGARTGAVFFPIGTATAFNPVSFSNTGTSDIFGVRVGSGISTSYTGETPGTLLTSGAVNNTWFITEGTAGGSNATVTLQWNAADELVSFDRSATVLGHYTAGSWSVGAAGAATGTNPFTYTRTGITSFSPFGILNNVATAVTTFTTTPLRLSTYPNPVITDVTVELTMEMQKERTTLQVVNTNGQILLQRQIDAGSAKSLTINMQQFGNGIYHILIKGKKINGRASVIKTK